MFINWWVPPESCKIKQPAAMPTHQNGHPYVRVRQLAGALDGPDERRRLQCSPRRTQRRAGCGWRSRRRHGKGRQSKDEFGWGTVQATIRHQAGVLGPTSACTASAWGAAKGALSSQPAYKDRTLRAYVATHIYRLFYSDAPLLLRQTSCTTNIMRAPWLAACAHIR
jgi:hypothetical protein